MFGAASGALFGVLYWRTSGHLRSQVDEWLQREQANFLQLDRDAFLERLSARKAADPTLERPFTLFDKDGNRIAGTPLDLAPMLLDSMPAGRPFDFHVNIDARDLTFRAIVTQTAFGKLLLAQTFTGIDQFEELLVRTFVWGGLLTLVLGLAGAAVAGTDAVRRIDAVTDTTRRIIAGDLSQRLTVYGGTGDLDRLAAVINGMLGEIEHLMKEVKGVGDNIAHDLRTPLTRLLAGLERAQRRAKSPEEYVEAVDEAIAEIRGILETFSALLRIAEVESGARRAGFSAVDLSAVAADVIELYEPIAEEKSIGLELAPSGARAPVILGDRGLLFEALANLVGNALKYTPPRGHVVVRSIGEAGRLGFEVTDSGPGIPPSEREAVLRRFYRVEESRHTPGTGLGLALVAAVARLHAMDLAIGDADPGCRITLTWRGYHDGAAASRAAASANISVGP